MPKPRYDEAEDETRHAAADEECCEEMSDRYNWNLKQVEQSAQSTSDVLSVDCVFDGYCDFPPSRMDLTQGDYFREEDDA